MGFGCVAIVNFSLSDLKVLLNLGVTLEGVFHFAHDGIVPFDYEDVRSFFDGLFIALFIGGLLFLGGLLLGIIEALAKAYISTTLANAIVFAVLIVVLLVKPAGLLGRYVPEKV